MTKEPKEIQLMRFDWAMKTVLRNKANFDVLEGFLTALLKEDVFVEEILESESNQQEKDNKFNRVDLLVKDKMGRRFIIEIQNQRQADFLERLLFGTSKVIVENLGLGEKYSDILKVVSVSILYFNLGVGEDYVYHGKTEFLGVHNHLPLIIKRKEQDILTQSIVFKDKNIFPEYYLINVERFEDLIEGALDEWIYFLKHNAIKPEFHAKNIDKARQKLTLLNMTEKERKRYEKYIDAMLVEQDVMETALKEGIAKGKAEGISEGIAKGELQKALEIAQRLKQQGLSIDLISVTTGLSFEQIESL